MAKRKPTNKYYFSVEGETEQWYLKWLQDTINNTEKAACKVSIDCPVRKNPLKHREDIEGLRINCIGINIHVEINGGRDLWIT